MRLLTTLLFAVTLSISAYAEDWRLVSNTDQGDRLIADIDSVEFKPYTIQTPNDGMRVAAIMMYTGKEFLPPFMVSLDSKQCIEDQGGVLINNFGEGEPKVYQWTSTGKRMYDAQGQWLCGYLKAKLRLKP